MPILVLEADFYKDITADLCACACSVLSAAGHDFSHERVPGAFELAPALALAMESGRFTGAVILGCVIRGETSHYDVVTTATAYSLQRLAVRGLFPLGFGLLTCDTPEQARVRASATGKNKGAEAARACLALLSLRQRLGL